MPYPFAYNPNYPQNYFAPAPQNSGLVWVQGETGAKSYFVAPGTNALLMDSESTRFFIKSVDQSGMPRPLRTFSYTEVFDSEAAPDVEKYVTHDELDRRLAELKEAPHE